MSKVLYRFWVNYSFKDTPKGTDPCENEERFKSVIHVLPV